ncbi:MAG: tetratricopeptide repeat protein [Pseudomonadota bacterium]
MTSLIHRLSLVVAAALVAIALSAVLSGRAFAMGIDEPAKPAGAPADKKDDNKDAKPAADSKAPDAKPADAKPAESKPADKKSDADFRDGYKLAYDAIYRQQDYGRGIVILSTLGRDDHPDVANLIGFASRKLGRTEDAKVWYEKALAADPDHSRTWQYYGLWHLERGDRARAEQHLERIRLICGVACEEYTSLRDALNGTVSY